MLEDINSLEIRGKGQWLCGFKKPPNLFAWELFGIEQSPIRAKKVCQDYLENHPDVESTSVIFGGNVIAQFNRKEKAHANDL